jgi:predicted nucleic acid-binding protein
MAVLIDASISIAIERRGVPAEHAIVLIRAEDAAPASITASELLAGVHRADSPARRLRREAFVEAILAALPVLPFDLRAARVYAELAAQLAAAGQPISAHDLLIAPTALADGSAVLTQNVRDFERVPGLLVQQPGW